MARDIRCEAPYQLHAITPEQAAVMKKRIECFQCGSFSLINTRYKVICSNCHLEKMKEYAGLRIVKDYSLLLPTNKFIGSHRE